MALTPTIAKLNKIPPHSLVFLSSSSSSSSTKLTTNSNLNFCPCSKKFIPKAASSSSVGGSGAEQLTGAKPSPKRRRIAGVDQEELLEPALLADPDSCFCEFNSLQIHHKLCDAESEVQNAIRDGISSHLPYPMIKLGVPIILLHGFGASVFSWNRFMKPLAQVTCSKILAFDRPAFGLTSRVVSFEQSSLGSEDTKPLNPYSMKFSVLATLHFIDLLKAEKGILVGHSAGANVAVEAYFEAPDRIAALILVAPAIVAPSSQQKLVNENQFGEDKPNQKDTSNSNVHENPFMRVFSILSKLYRYIAQAIAHFVKGVARMLNTLYKKALTAFLRSAIAVIMIRFVIDKFGILAVRNAWYDSKKVTDHDLEGYTKPLRVKGWDKALLEFTAATLTDSVSKSKPAIAKRLNEISCPGDNDRIVPSWNAKRLSQAIPGSCLEIIKNCGHLPHEEKVEEFISIFANFLQKAFGSSEAQPLQAAT